MTRPLTHALVLSLVLLGCDEGPSDVDGGAAGDGGGTTLDGGGSPRDAGPRPDGAPPDDDAGVGVDAGPSECDDGIDNDGDGFIDWGRDLGCWGPGDRTEAALSRAEEDGYTTFDVGDDSVVIYVAEDGDDGADGLTPETAVATIEHAASLVRDGENDFVLLRRGDTWRGPYLRRFKSGRDADHPMVIAAYGDSPERPRIEVDGMFLNHDGQARSFVALVGIHFVTYAFDPDDPEFNGGNGDHATLRYVGGGQHLLVESCHFEYGEIVVQSCCDQHYEDVEVRRNVIEKAYHAATCSPGNPDGDSTHRPSGMYSSHVDGLLIEENLFDHNGWNEDVETACATIYNHNLYLNGNDVVIRGNVLSRASSIQIKLRSDTTGDMRGLVVEDNFFVEGEIGVSLGGNSDEAYRFEDSTIRRNVLSELGRSRPTTRSLAWGVGLQDNDGATIVENLFLNQREEGVGNSWALQIGAPTNRDVTVEDNLFYRIQGRAIRVRPASAHASIRIASNELVDPDQGSCLVDHQGAFDAYTYEDNAYASSAAADAQMCLDGGRVSLDAWRTASGETGATAASPSYPDPDRTIETYTTSLGLGATLDDYLAAARQTSRTNPRPELRASAINAYIRAGFGR